MGGATLKITAKGKYRSIEHFVSDKIRLMTITRSEIKQLGYAFVEILNKYMLNEGSYKMEPSAPSTVERKRRMGFPRPEQMLYEQGTFLEAVREVKVVNTPTTIHVTTGPSLDSVHHSASSKESITYGQLVDWIIFGHASIIPERNVFSPAILEWDEKVFQPFLRKMVLRGKSV